MIETQKSNRWNPRNPLSEKSSTRTRAPLSAIQKQCSWFNVFILAGLAISQLTQADGHDKNPLDIIDQMEQLYRGSSSDSKITMVIETPRYQRSMQMSGQSMGREFGFFRILSPKKDRGIATLKRDEEMWNYFPKINKVIKVPPSMMMGSWMGSDFTNDDLVKETQLIDAYNIQMTETDDQYRFTLTPKEQTVTVWGSIDYVVSKSPLLPLSQSFFDDQGEKIRVMTFSAPKEIGGRLMPSILEIEPLNKPGHRTRVIYDEIVFDPPGITEQTFSMRNLKSRF
jgi:outer membrane lipoprotein-sorting protein